MSNTNITLRPFRDYDEKDVINVYTLSGYTQPLPKGTLVKITGAGISSDNETIEMIGSFGDFAPSNVVAQRYGVVPKITPINGQADPVLGMTLFDARDFDENSYPLKYYPRKAAEMEAVISGQSMPVVTRGIFAYSGITTGSGLAGSVSAGQPLFPGADAALTTQIFNAYTINDSGTSINISGKPIATALGNTDAKGVTIILLHVK
jgi:hypothetical protein